MSFSVVPSGTGMCRYHPMALPPMPQEPNDPPREDCPPRGGRYAGCGLAGALS